VSVHASSPRAIHALDAVVARAGGVLAWHGDDAVAINYGSSAGELAACVSAVGIGDRSELVKLELGGPRRILSAAITDLTGFVLAPGGAICTGSVWWCAVGPERVLVLSEPAGGDRLRSRIRALSGRHPGLELRDASHDRAAIAVVGRRARLVLADLGVYGDSANPRSVTPVSSHPVGGGPAVWLLQSDHRALAVMDHADAASAWRAIHHAGRRHGICAVGQEALARYSLLARSHLDL
jgi:glycine cleavage system aminomethyltransferase T